jgi:hypothetical protein
MNKKREAGEHCIIRSSPFTKYNKFNLFKEVEMNRACSRPTCEEMRNKYIF